MSEGVNIHGGNNARTCRSCGLVIEAGKAYELAGSNWHTYCFKCSRCERQLDTETKLLLQGDDLICSNCSYICYSCGKRIEDLAILTGDQAFCASCFVCRNCKRRIEDLKYARTNQGVFCMTCHEALLARKSRRAKQRQQQQLLLQQQQEHKAVDTNKSLPSIPVGEHEPHPSSAPTTPAPSSATSTPNPRSHTSEFAEFGPASRKSEDDTRSWTNDERCRKSEESQREIGSATRNDDRPRKNEDNRMSVEIGSSPHGHHTPAAGSNTGGAVSSPNSTGGRSLHGASHSVNNPVVPGHTNRAAIYVDSVYDNAMNGLGVSRGTEASNEQQKHDYLGSPIFSDTDDLLPSEFILSSDRSLTLPERSALRPRSQPGSPRIDAKLDASIDSGGGSRRASKIPRMPLSISSTASNVSSSSSTKVREGSNADSVPMTPRDILDPGKQQLSSPVSLSGRTDVSSDDDLLFVTPNAESTLGATEGSARTTMTGEYHGSAGPINRNYLTPDARASVMSGVRTRRSASDVPQTKASAAAAVAASGVSVDEALVSSSRSAAFEAAASVSSSHTQHQLTKQLVEARQKIAALEATLNTKQSAGSSAARLEEEIAEKRKTVANLEAKSKVAEKELKVLKRTPRSEEEGGGAVAPRKVIDDFTAEMASVKNSLISEIQNLIVSRDELKQEIAQLTRERDLAIEESSMLNIRNTQLADLNNELQQQLVSKYGPLKGMTTSVSSTSILHHHHQHYHSNSNSNNLNVTPNFNNINNANQFTTNTTTTNFNDTNNYVTVLEGPSPQAKQHTRKFWRRPGAVVAKGLKGVFASEIDTTTNNSTTTAQSYGPPAVTILSPPFGPVDTQSTNGTSHTTSGSSSVSTNAPPPSLEECVAKESGNVPSLVLRCIEEVERRGLNTEGIYRKSGAQSHIASITEAFKSGDASAVESILEDGDIAGATSALKQFLRHLPVPVITFDAYDDYIRSNGNVDKLKRLVNSLPTAHKDTLEVLIKHLSLVADHCSINLMTPKNLAVVFAPTLARDRNADREVTDMQTRNEVTQLLIENYQEVFAV